MWPGRTGEERGKGRHSSPGDVRGQEWASVHLLGSCCPPSYRPPLLPLPRRQSSWCSRALPFTPGRSALVKCDPHGDRKRGLSIVL